MNSRSLLLVDGDTEVHEQLTDLLRRDDRRIEGAYDGKEALERLRACACDVVVVGQGRNGFDPLKLLRRVRAIRPDTKVIVTGDPDPRKVADAIRYHAYSYFHKPLPGSQFAETVQQALEAASWKDDIRVVSARPEWMSLDVRCKMPAAERTTHFLRELLSDLAANVREDVGAAFRELLLNAVEHGGKSDRKSVV